MNIAGVSSLHSSLCLTGNYWNGSLTFAFWMVRTWTSSEHIPLASLDYVCIHSSLLTYCWFGKWIQITSLFPFSGTDQWVLLCITPGKTLSLPRPSSIPLSFCSVLTLIPHFRPVTSDTSTFNEFSYICFNDCILLRVKETYSSHIYENWCKKCLLKDILLWI